MAKNKIINIAFPLAGLFRQGAYRQQPPYTTPDALNVRAIAEIEGRERGGSRPGLIKSHVTDLGSEVRMLAPMVINLDPFKTFIDTFAGTSLAACWSQASWSSDTPNILPEALASIDTEIGEGDIVLDQITDLDTSEIYQVDIDIIQWDREYHGEYRLFLRMDNTTPDVTADGVEIVLTSTGSSGVYTAVVNSYASGVKTEIDTASGTIGAAIPSWLAANVNGDVVTVYWNGTQILSGTVDTHSGTRVGFGMECTVDGGLCLVNVFRVQYYSTTLLTSNRTMLIASAGGDLFYEQYYGSMTSLSTNLSLSDDYLLTAVQSGQKLYIADYGDLRVSGTDGTLSGGHLDAVSVDDWTALGINTYDDVCVISNVGGATTAGTYEISAVGADYVTLASDPGDGTASYRIERAPKVFDPDAGTLSIWSASAGQIPTGCPLICRFMDRTVLAGQAIAPHVWYMSRQTDPDDWDYSQTDSQAAVAGSASEAGVPGTAILTLIAYSDDYLIMGCRNELWRMRGDPRYGGILDNVSRIIGIIGPNAWTFGPEGELIFLSLDGLYILPPGGDSTPVPVSRDVLPREFRNIDPDNTIISLQYDTVDNGVHIFLTSTSSNLRTHWWFDWRRKTFWPVSIDADHEPTVTTLYNSYAVEDASAIFGCRDGYIRRFSQFAETDDGTEFTSYAMIGPIALADDGMFGSVKTLQAVIAADSGDITWSLQPANTFEGTITASESDTGTWIEGLNYKNYPACKGQAFVLKLTGTAGRRWAMENIVAELREAGKLRHS